LKGVAGQKKGKKERHSKARDSPSIAKQDYANKKKNNQEIASERETRVLWKSHLWHGIKTK